VVAASAKMLREHGNCWRAKMLKEHLGCQNAKMLGECSHYWEATSLMRFQQLSESKNCHCATGQC